MAAFASGLWLAAGVRIPGIEPILFAWLFPLLAAAIATEFDPRVRQFLTRPPRWLLLIWLPFSWYTLAVAIYSLFVMGQLNNPGLICGGLAAPYASASMMFWAELLLSDEVRGERSND